MEPSPTLGRLTEQDRHHHRLMSAPPAMGTSSHLIRTEMEAAPPPPPFLSINWCHTLFIFLVIEGLKVPLTVSHWSPTPAIPLPPPTYKKALRAPPPCATPLPTLSFLSPSPRCYPHWARVAAIGLLHRPACSVTPPPPFAHGEDPHHRLSLFTQPRWDFVYQSIVLAALWWATTASFALDPPWTSAAMFDELWTESMPFFPLDNKFPAENPSHLIKRPCLSIESSRSPSNFLNRTPRFWIYF
jgi:hypothetical protein